METAFDDKRNYEASYRLIKHSRKKESLSEEIYNLANRVQNEGPNEELLDEYLRLAPQINYIRALMEYHRDPDDYDSIEQSDSDEE